MVDLCSPISSVQQSKGTQHPHGSYLPPQNEHPGSVAYSKSLTVGSLVITGKCSAGTAHLHSVSGTVVSSQGLGDLPSGQCIPLAGRSVLVCAGSSVRAVGSGPLSPPRGFSAVGLGVCFCSPWLSSKEPGACYDLSLEYTKHPFCHALLG